MSTVHAWKHRWRTFFHAREVRGELEEEMRAHIELAAQQHLASGNEPDRAQQEFGSVTRWTGVVEESWPRSSPGELSVLPTLVLILAVGIAGASAILSAASALKDAGGSDSRFLVALALVRASAIMFAVVAAAAALDLKSAWTASPVFRTARFSGISSRMLILCTLATSAAAVVAQWSTHVIRDALPGEIAKRVPGWELLSVNWPLFGVATLVVVAPVLWMRLDLSSAPQRRMIQAMRTAQIALTVVLVAAATTMTRSALNIAEADVGFEPAATWTIRVRPMDSASPAPWDSLLMRVTQSADVRDAGVVTHLPLTMAEVRQGVSAEAVASHRRREGAVRLQAATGSYFAALGVPLLHGRPFDTRDHAESDPVAIVNQKFASLYTRAATDLAFVTVKGVRRRVVGVVGDVRHFGADAAVAAEVYVPVQQESRTHELDLIVRHTGNCAETCVRRLVTAIERTGDFELLGPGLEMSERRRRQYAGYRLASSLLMVFAGAAFLIALLVVCLSFAGRASERRSLSRRLIVHSQRPSGVAVRFPSGELGVVLAIAGVLLLLRLTQRVTFGLGPYDKMSLVAAATGIVALWAAARIRGRADG